MQRNASSNIQNKRAPAHRYLAAIIIRISEKNPRALKTEGAIIVNAQVTFELDGAPPVFPPSTQRLLETTTHVPREAV
jgi:hypothetical protein